MNDLGDYYMIVATGTERQACADLFRSKQLAEKTVEYLGLVGADVRRVSVDVKFLPQEGI